MKRTFAGFALMALAACSNGSNNSALKDDSQTVTAYRQVVLHSPQRLVDRLNANQISDAKQTAQALYLVWEAISPESSLYTPDFANKICNEGMQFACAAIINSKSELKSLYSGFGHGNSLTIAQVKQFAAAVLARSIAEGVAPGNGSANNGSTGAVSFVCGMTDTDATPYLTFIVKSSAGASNASISYIRSAFFGSEEVQIERAVPGCEAENVGHAGISSQEIHVECSADGDAGFLSAERQGSSLNFAGNMTFPNSGIEGYNDTSIPVSCRKQ